MQTAADVGAAHRLLTRLLPRPLPVLSKQYKTYKVVYRRYAGLYFIFCVDVTDNELLYLESIHLFVEVGCCCAGRAGVPACSWVGDAAA